MGRMVGFCARALAVVCFFESVAFAQAPPAEPASAEAPRAKPRKHRHRARPPGQPWRKRAHAKQKGVEPREHGPRSAWHFLLGAERLTSVLHFDLESSTPGTGSVSATELSLFGAGSASGLNPFGLPRLGFDALYGVFTFGGSLVYATTSNDVGDASMLLLSPRLGAFWPKTGVVRVWLRGGLSYVSAESDVAATTFEGQRVVIGEAELSYLDLTLEPLLVLMPSEQVGITLGPIFDFGLAGSGGVEYNQASGMSPVDVANAHASSYGAAAGLLVLF